ncbi:ABC transporter ATP-binding protein [Maledivibacter halophilus]|uniref:ABC-2 type transport system ATP-binding protein n=1 Tax=Maledivibacter halophilus TaxID=36842 RepID=A0A1T5MBN7_9FIRM|nr:ABC transporter ATP-binding protein [Maledivibacter halophilus]SKC85585.1 ABC-2 type transport system ATP-binding protein [Maledivibacter halophilus]
MIEIKGVTKKYGNFTAVDNVDIRIPRGSFFALLGPNGAGKTTLIRMLIGLAKPSTGEILINNMKVHRNNNKLKKMIGIVPQYTNLDKELTVRENLIFSAKIFKIPRRKASEKIDQLLEFVELKEIEDRETNKLSGGMKRKLMIAKALINDPQVIFLDEPTVGIDLNSRRKIWDILKSMKKQGKTILLTTHYIEEADYLCNSVSLMNNGRIFYYDTPENLKRLLGEYTLEYFNQEDKTEYKYFESMEEARIYSNNIKTEFTIRKTTLEDVFYNFTNRKVI